MFPTLSRSPALRMATFLSAPLLLTATLSLPAQTPTPSVRIPSYDVVSIKPNKTASTNDDISIYDSTFDGINVSLKMLILSAYGLKQGQLVGLPPWGYSARFDVSAKIVDPDKKAIEALTPEQFRSMQQPILTDRFHLTFHHELKMLPVFELVVAKGGPKFKTITAAERASDQGVNGVHAGDTNEQTNSHGGTLTATGVPLSVLIAQLSTRVDRIVVDKTGLTGEYNLQLTWSPEDAGPQAADAPPDIFTALQEQLGLKLQPAKGEIETFVVDHVDMPSEN